MNNQTLGKHYDWSRYKPVCTRLSMREAPHYMFGIMKVVDWNSQ